MADDAQGARAAERQLTFIASAAAESPTDHAMFLLALMDRETPPSRVTVVLAKEADADGLPPVPAPGRGGDAAPAAHYGVSAEGRTDHLLHLPGS